MSNPNPLPVSNSERPQRSRADVPSSRISAESPKVASVTPAGPRKLIRPTLPARAAGSRPFTRRTPLASATPFSLFQTPVPHHSSHAENFYLKKQAQGQTLMVVVLEDGEQIEGYIEWYDRDAIKVRHGSRTLVYKSSIKYLYKASDSFRA